MARKRKRVGFWIKLGLLILVGALVLATAVDVVISLLPKKATEISVEQAQKVLDEKMDRILQEDRPALDVLRERSEITVQSLEYGTRQDVTLSCSYRTIDAYATMMQNLDNILNFGSDEELGRMPSTKIRLKIETSVAALFESAQELSGTVDIVMYEVDGKFEVYPTDDVVNKCYGGILKLSKEIAGLKTIRVNGEEVDVSVYRNVSNGLVKCVELSVESRSVPDNSHPIIRWWNDFCDEFQRNFGGSGWRLLLKGLGTTLGITVLALLIGLVLGIVVAIIRCTHDKLGILRLPDRICRLYLTVTRGTPVMVQLLVIFFVALAPAGVSQFVAAVICFGLNSGAYVAEIVRGGIMAVDDGQMEAGRSLGFNYVQTMWYIIIPQAFKAVLPALANEFITLLKETSVASCIGVADLTFYARLIQGRTYSAFMPLLAVALVYLVLVLFLSYMVKLLERRLRKSDRG